ncbi:hypothetical protein E2C01_027356 [Portunus trituberculatus]|uniref:Uncharacterized protein n=1 Tax=Portunus trituberculatus TaxID=210409 RepID=A0A5B7EKL8_PORTR|nr:hypothetical protein [Portunus trituberculatus]
MRVSTITIRFHDNDIFHGNDANFHNNDASFYEKNENFHDKAPGRTLPSKGLPQQSHGCEGSDDAPYCNSDGSP